MNALLAIITAIDMLTVLIHKVHFNVIAVRAILEMEFLAPVRKYIYI